MERKGMSRSEVESLLEHYEKMNISFGSGRIFGSMCTSPHPFALEVHSRFHESNLGNPGLCQGTVEMERSVISMLGSLMHLEEPFGHVLSGGTEANITSMYTSKMRSSGRRVVFPRSSHFSILKSIRLLDMEPVPVDLDDDYRMDLGDLESKMDDSVAMVIAVAGTTELGAVDPVDKIFVLPFLEEMDMLDDRTGTWDFRVDGVTTLSTDPHKMGWSTIPAGCLLFREPHPLKYLAVSSPYLTSPKAYTLAGTRDSGAAASAFAMIKHLGREGYCELVSRCMENTNYLAKRLEELGLQKVMEPVMNIVAVHHEEPEKIQKLMSKEGFYISKVCDPSALRFVIMPHVERGPIDAMIEVLGKVLKV
jgi:tyrosine decarboxylase/aspartate 1-decarboxylase